MSHAYTIIISCIIFGLIALPFGLVLYMHMKTAGKILVRVVNAAGEETQYLLRTAGSLITEPNSKGRSYVVKDKALVSPRKYPIKDEAGNILVDKDGNPMEGVYYVRDANGKEYAGSCIDTFYPAGWPSALQVRIKTMDCNEGNPNAINRYGTQEALNISDIEIGAIKQEQFSNVVVEASKDFEDLFNKFKGAFRSTFPVLAWVALILVIILAAASVYLSYKNGQAIANIWG